jgi:GNAT superfamily N-acetyltransferase
MLPMRELRTHITDEKQFLEQVQRQHKQAYQLAFLKCEGEVRAVAGYRFLESLFSGKNLYVDDLVTRDSDRSRGFGGELMDWLMDEERANRCETLELACGVQRFDAHRFYFSKRMSISSYHFRSKVEPES